MIKHIVFFNFKDEACGADKPANMARAGAMLEALMGRVPTLRSMAAGPNAVPGASAWDFALVAEFDDAEGLKAYTDHPAHREVSAFMSKVRRDRASVDFEF
jgi:hypothetical protein